MDTEKIIKATEKFIKKRLADEPTGHDWWHANRVRTMALKIHEKEGGDRFTIELAALLHDVGDRKVLGTYDDDPTIAENFLKEQLCPQATIEAVMYIIQNISFSKSLGKESTQHPIELLIVQDADRFDALGALGIARAFAYGGANGRPLYDPAYLPQVFTNADDYKKAGGSTLHHFDEKLFLLKDRLNTETAKHIAAERDAYMHEFYDRFLNEWSGKS